MIEKARRLVLACLIGVIVLPILLAMIFNAIDKAQGRQQRAQEVRHDRR